MQLQVLESPVEILSIQIMASIGTSEPALRKATSNFVSEQVLCFHLHVPAPILPASHTCIGSYIL